ncbi:hypothetical protein [Bacillus vallismortis]|nr:hypothetical protein [Bacillus vallismortis]
MFVSKKEHEKLKDKVDELEKIVFNMALELRTIKEANEDKEPTVYFS